MYQKNDIILYAPQGVCQIMDITKKEFNGKLIEYYVLRPIYSETALIYVPFASEQLAGKMRRVLSREEVCGLIQNMPEEEPEWIENEQSRSCLLYTSDAADEL